jgi:hypothetical protein
MEGVVPAATQCLQLTFSSFPFHVGGRAAPLAPVPVPYPRKKAVLFSLSLSGSSFQKEQTISCSSFQKEQTISCSSFHSHSTNMVPGRVLYKRKWFQFWVSGF